MENTLTNTVQSKPQRNSKFELLRIFCIFGIICSHFAVHGMSGIDRTSFTVNNFILDFFSIGSICVAIFMVISGFFMSKSTKFSFHKLASLLLEAVFYSLIFFSVSSVYNKSFSITQFYSSFFSVFLGETWFVGCYLIIYLFHPFINKLLNSLNDKLFTIFIVCILICTTIITTLPGASFFCNQLISTLSLSIV